MWLSLSLVAALCCSLVKSRITFTTSEVLDTVDLKGAMATAEFRCAAGCRVYSPTQNDKIVIENSVGKQCKTLFDLAQLKMGESYELLPENGPYKLRNKGSPDPNFVFYAVEKGATNYMTPIVYVTSLSSPTISASHDTVVTVMSATGAVRFSSFQGDFSGALPSVYAAPADSIGKCRAVYTASTTSTIPLTNFPVNSPIATINFKQTGTKSVVVSGDSGTTKSGEGASAVYVSPGYVGCTNLKDDALYTFLPRVLNMDTMDYLKNSNGLHMDLNGDYSIANAANPLKLTIDDDVYKLSGTNTISKTKDATSMNIFVSWSYPGGYPDGSKDRFALQIDVTSKGTGPGPGPVVTTLKPGPGPVPTTKGSVATTTSESVGPVGMLTSSLILVISLLISIR